MARPTTLVYPSAEDLGVDVFDPGVFGRGMPWDDFARLRELAPVCWHEEPEVQGWSAGSGFWAVTGWEDIRHIGRATEAFSSWAGGTQLRDPEPKDLSFWREMLLNMDPPEHTRLRRIVATAFTSKVLAHRERMIRSQASQLVDAVVSRGRCDFAEEIGAELPLRTITDVMGLAQSDRHLLAKWTDRVIGYQDDELVAREHGDEQPKVNPRSREALVDMLEYARAVAVEKRAHPGDDLLSILVNAEVDGERLSDEEFETFFFLFTVAGNDTTHSALPGGLLALIRFPDELDRLIADPHLLPGAVEEMLRFAPPVIHFRRTATRDVELDGQLIRSGDKVAVFYPAGNRDPGVFASPDRFDVGRSPNPHLAFGTGAHVCIG
ncbi:MAG: cytochrome P450, partial [Acidimicrobiia bacterium]